MAEIIFRKMTLADVDAVAELDKENFGVDAWSRQFFAYAAKNPYAKYIVAEFEKKIIACAGLEIYEGEADISTVAVTEKFRRRGIAQKMFSKLIRSAKKRGAKFIFAEVRTDNLPSMRLCEKFGFMIIGREKNYYANGEDAFVMGLKI